MLLLFPNIEKTEKIIFQKFYDSVAKVISKVLLQCFQSSCIFLVVVFKAICRSQSVWLMFHPFLTYSMFAAVNFTNVSFLQNITPRGKERLRRKLGEAVRYLGYLWPLLKVAIFCVLAMSLSKIDSILKPNWWTKLRFLKLMTLGKQISADNYMHIYFIKTRSTK